MVSTTAVEHAVLQSIGIQLTPEFTAVLDAEPRELIVLGGWRAGKSEAGAAKIMKRIIMWKVQNAALASTFLVWMVGPDYQQTHAEFDRLSGWLAKLGWLEFSSTNMEGPRQMRIKGLHGKPAVIIDTKSSTNEERLGSVAPDYILGCESGQMSEEARFMLVGRAAEKRANVCFTGTLEDEEKEVWVWYTERGEEWLNGSRCNKPHDCAAEHNAISLPSWSNPVVYPLGRSDPEILRQEEILPPRKFKRYIAGIPTGIQYQVYDILDEPDRRFEVTWAEFEDILGTPPRLLGAYGGIDFGDVHPTSITVGQLYEDPRDQTMAGPHGIVLVRENWYNDRDPGNTAKLHEARKELSKRYKAWRWATDPNERYLANDTGAEAVSGSRRSREFRVNLTNTRLDLGKLYFLKDAPGISKTDRNVGLVEEMRHIRRKRQNDGQLVLVRLNDDRAASLEDMIELIDGKPRLRVPKASTVRKRPSRPVARIRRIA